MIGRTLGVVIAGVVLLDGCCNTDGLPSAPEPVSSADPSEAGRPQRCRAVGREERVGQGRADTEENVDKVLPFATEVGAGAAFEGGYAIGALRQKGGGTEVVVVTANIDGSAWKTISLGASHGDGDAPRVFARGKSLGVAILEPSGATRTLRLGHVDRDNVSWGAELLQGHDESLAFDVVLGAERGVAVWDDVPKDRDVGGIYLSTFDPATMARASQARVVTLPGTDAESPRVVEREGGFWLFWVARRPQMAEYDARYAAEDIAYRWIEAVPLDERGEVNGTARRIGTEKGHVLAYDVAAMPDGSAVVMWRDDDTPSGSVGGQLLRAHVRLGGVDGPDPIGGEETGVGAPNVMPGWLALADVATPTRLAPMMENGSLSDRFASEDLLGSGEPVAAHGDRLLVSRPDGTAVRLYVVQCSRAVVDAGVVAEDGGD